MEDANNSARDQRRYMGPNGPLSHGSALLSIEHITKYKSVVPSQKALDDFIEHTDTFLTRIIWNAKCRSWLKGGKGSFNVYKLGKEDEPALVHPGSRLHWVHMLMNPRWEEFELSTVNQNRFAYLGNVYGNGNEG
ncbi:hypothetical protein GGP41_007332 [Bipolaris sorokiniana]|uniref:Uncharacterized protein n=1 Tax=Cochliobolus sativus TaxID=45130 RepID=A0A8H5ZVB4_COCSA|nr:hypothetical protein GGP41_007332 [Bipolaris sorokiniana]